MSKIIQLKKCLDIRLVGEADKTIASQPKADRYAIKPTDFIGVTPKMLVKEGDKVKAGSPLFFDKYHPTLLFTSPVTGVVEAVVRGEKRKILEVVINPSSQQEFEAFAVDGEMAAAKIKELMLTAGLWPFIIQRPYGIIASENDTPRDIFVSLFDTAPLAPDMELIINSQRADFEKGISVLSKLTSGNVYLGANQTNSETTLSVAKGNVVAQQFRGSHPTGCVGVQINHIAPINKGEIIWTVDAQAVAIIGRFFATGKVDMTKIIALAGSEVVKPQYCKTVYGATIESIVGANIKPQAQGDNVRIINGNVLTGTTTSKSGYLSFYNNIISIIPEGDKSVFVGWIAPRCDKFSVSHMLFSWLTPNKKYRLDTNTNGGKRAFVMTGEYEKVVPMDIYPVYLLKAILANDIDKMENLGIYEVIEEDFALCDFVCTSKIDVQQIIRDGINSMIKELN
ncbi:MAG: Na(+)-translocating NADH-quinone reductase subunit A [Rikenellaceae bacterium]